MIKIGLLGCGRIIRRHIEHLEARPQANIVALCDVDREAVRTTKETWFADREVAEYYDPSVLFSEAGLDAVVIATPHTLHFEHATMAIRAGCHVFLEKPMVTSTEQAYALDELARSYEKIVAIGFNTSSKKAFRFLRNCVREARYGALEMVNGYLSQDWMRKTSGSWRQNPALSGGGQAYDSGAHIINSLLWSVESEPELVFALADHKDLPVDINSVVTIRFASGVLANITISGNCAAAGQHMVFIFEEGRVEIDGWTGGWIRVFADGHDEEPAIEEEEVYPVNNFIDAIEGNASVAAGVGSGINHSMLMDGIYESARTGRPVFTKRAASGGA